MKTGIILIIAAVAFFSGSIVWSVTQPVERDLTPRTKFPALSVSRQTNNMLFYDAGQAVSCRVNAPVNILLDDQFSGVEITGDTSISKLLKVHNLQYTLGEKSSSALVIGFADSMSATEWYNSSFDDYEEKMDRIDSANITVRIGLKPDSEDRLGRTMNFRLCKNVSTVAKISAKKLLLHTGSDTTSLTLDVKSLELSGTGDMIRLKGNADRVHYVVQQTQLDAAGLITDEAYFQQCSNVNFDIFAKEIVNTYRSQNCNFKISGNPSYQRTEKPLQVPGI